MTLTEVRKLIAKTEALREYRKKLGQDYSNPYYSYNLTAMLRVELQHLYLVLGSKEREAGNKTKRE